MTTNILLDQTKERENELLNALEIANTRLLGALMKMNDFLSHGLDVDLPTQTDADMTKRAYEETRRILKKYSK